MTCVVERPEVEVFTQHHCASCRQAENYLRERGVVFASRNVSSDQQALNEIFQRGFMTTPVIRIGDIWIGGFKRREIERLLPT